MASFRVRWAMGRVEGRDWELDQDLLDPNNDSECRDLRRPRPDACDS